EQGSAYCLFHAQSSKDDQRGYDEKSSTSTDEPGNRTDQNAFPYDQGNIVADLFAVRYFFLAFPDHGKCRHKHQHGEDDEYEGILRDRHTAEQKHRIRDHWNTKFSSEVEGDDGRQTKGHISISMNIALSEVRV